MIITLDLEIRGLHAGYWDKSYFGGAQFQALASTLYQVIIMI